MTQFYSFRKKEQNKLIKRILFFLSFNSPVSACWLVTCFTALGTCYYFIPVHILYQGGRGFLCTDLPPLASTQFCYVSLARTYDMQFGVVIWSEAIILKVEQARRSRTSADGGGSNTTVCIVAFSSSSSSPLHSSSFLPSLPSSSVWRSNIPSNFAFPLDWFQAFHLKP